MSIIPTKQQILDLMDSYCLENSIKFESNDLSAAIFDCGLDSMDFSAIVARLEIEFGVDPFRVPGQASYPASLQEFIDAYI
jgi:hypothetical protein